MKTFWKGFVEEEVGLGRDFKGSNREESFLLGWEEVLGLSVPHAAGAPSLFSKASSLPVDLSAISMVPKQQRPEIYSNMTRTL